MTPHSYTVNVCRELPKGSYPEISSKWLSMMAKQMLSIMAAPPLELTVVVCGDPWMTNVNARFRNQNKPTDVLAFPTPAPSMKGVPWLLGDIVISLETASKQAQKAHKTLVEEVTMLLAHGLVHLFGFDHVSRDEDRRMRARVDFLCRVAPHKKR